MSQPPKPPEEEEEKRGKLEILSQFDKSYLVLQALQYFNAGMRAMMMLSVNFMFKDYLNLDPSVA